ncbi:subclass B1 metallo-beta-lactamase [Lewinella sp. IMCC34183]|uniref:subclass B1 metallo-beta-lactamase n=1 Tax=Lewinella sp. IMCC34183 TaxID=2248762 RepID=UPI000E26CA48|nr:subclass B1 metallo-beta-lactamase [Lewinella sp. IMCC34183]
MTFRSLLLSLLGLAAGVLTAQDSLLYHSPILEVEQLAPGTYLHRSFLSTDDYGKVACNGVVFTDGREAVVLDTPVDTLGSVELIEFLQRQLGLRVIAVVPTHFHDDCLGGLAAFHVRGISSYGNEKTAELATAHGAIPPRRTFAGEKMLRVGDREVLISHPGAGHTRDNVVAYFAADQTLFGGCLVKSLGAGKGNLADADTAAWSASVVEAMARYPRAVRIVPGHGTPGDRHLLEFTRDLFAEDPTDTHPTHK